MASLLIQQIGHLHLDKVQILFLELQKTLFFLWNYLQSAIEIRVPWTDYIALQSNSFVSVEHLLWPFQSQQDRHYLCPQGLSAQHVPYNCEKLLKERWGTEHGLKAGLGKMCSNFTNTRWKTLLKTECSCCTRNQVAMRNCHHLTVSVSLRSVLYRLWLKAKCEF